MKSFIVIIAGLVHGAVNQNKPSLPLFVWYKAMLSKLSPTSRLSRSFSIGVILQVKGAVDCTFSEKNGLGKFSTIFHPKED